MTGPATPTPRPAPRLTLAAPWLLLDLGVSCRIAGWPVVGPSLGLARRITWLQVVNADLPPGTDPAGLFGRRAGTDGINADVGLMTAADVTRYRHVRREENGVAVDSVATSGLGNGESVVARRPGMAGRSIPPHPVGTINVVAALSQPLSTAAMLEALSVAAEARTAAVLALGLVMPGDGRPVTGTGTDCIVVASPEEADAARHCGLHTTAGRLLGETVYQAVLEASREWLTTQHR